MSQPDPSQYRDASRGKRLQKILAEAGFGSRRECEELIEQGAVRINGTLVKELPLWADPRQDRITVNGELVEGAERHVYVMLYKPRHTLSTAEDPSGRRTVLDLVRHPSGVRLYPVGRLDYDTMGLMLLTNDGELANRLTHPRFEVHKTYRATVKGVLSEEDVRKLERGLFLADRREGQTHGASRTQGISMRVVFREHARTIMDITLREGRNRQVRRMLAQMGCPVKKLIRTQMGPLKLKGLRLGEWRELDPTEIRMLRKAAADASRMSNTPSSKKQAGGSRSRIPGKQE